MSNFDVFIDEACHLENDHIPIMCIGYIKVPTNDNVYEGLKNEFKEKTSFNYFQHLHSDHNIFFQLADFFIGAVAYKSRVTSGNIIEPTAHKLEFINYLEEKSGFNLDEGTEPWETKFNIFDHQPKRRS